MRKLMPVAMAFVISALLLAGCSSKAKDEQIASLQAQLTETRQELDQVRDQQQRAEARNRQLQTDLDSLATLENVVVEMKEHYTVLRVPDQLMFASGQARVNRHGRQLLDQVADILSRYPEYEIRIVGHTDNKQIKPEFQSKFASNWELSTARATNVVHYLTEQKNLDPERLMAVGEGEHDPIATNDTVAGRAENRRVEFLIAPKLPVKQLGETEQPQQDKGEQILP
jgi:chemotaxis protein MotB